MLLLHRLVLKEPVETPSPGIWQDDLGQER